MHVRSARARVDPVIYVVSYMALQWAWSHGEMKSFGPQRTDKKQADARYECCCTKKKYKETNGRNNREADCHDHVKKGRQLQK